MRPSLLVLVLIALLTGCTPIIQYKAVLPDGSEIVAEGSSVTFRTLTPKPIVTHPTEKVETTITVTSKPLASSWRQYLGPLGELIEWLLDHTVFTANTK